MNTTKPKSKNMIEGSFDEVLMEMPYLFNLDQHGIETSGSHFDLELEKARDIEALTHYIKGFFADGTKTDIYGNSIFINGQQDRETLLKVMLDDATTIKYITKIGKFSSHSTARRWLLTTMSAHIKDQTLTEAWRDKYRIYVVYKSDGTRKWKDSVNAYSGKQALSYFLRKIPEYRNERLFEVYAEKEEEKPSYLPYRDD